MQNIEYQEQVKIFEWARINSYRYPDLKLLNSSLNGIKIHNIKAAARAKKAGMKKGYPDIFLPTARGGYFGLFIELKRPANKLLGTQKGSSTQEQREWIEILNTQNYKAKICYGASEAIELLKEYLENEKTRANNG